MTITREAAIEAMREVVEAKGADYVYPRVNGRCFYSDHGEASCIVGAVIKKLDPEAFDRIAKFEVGERGFRNAFGFEDVSRTPEGYFPHVDVDDEALNALIQAQVYQDRGQTWGEAFEAAQVRR